MKHKGLLIIPALIAAITAPQLVSAHVNVGSQVKPAPVGPSINAACVEATAQSDLAVNNVRCRVLMGDMWWDFANAVYEVPKGGGVMAIFAGSLWIGGIDVGGQLKVAAQTYRQTGNDFWPGPLDTTSASTDLDICAKYDKHFRITRKEVETYVSGGPITSAISNWPGNGDQSKGQAQYLAPFFDANGDGMYTPSAGDYPGYDLVAGDGYGECQEVNCIPVDQLFGDETLWWVFNDKGNIHTETGGQAIGLEIRAQAFGFFTDDEINNMTFYNYRIFNRSTFKVDSCYFGVWADADLGCYTDDYVGCDVKRGLGYTYNGDNDDEVNCASPGYGLNPPAIGIDFFRGPIADATDGKDNNRNCTTDESCEQIVMSGFMYYENTNGVPYGNPSGATHFYNYLKMKWGDGIPVRYDGATGYNTSGTGPICNFMFPGSPTTDEHDWGIGGNCSTAPTLPAWDEVTSGNTPNDRRMLESAGPFTLMPGAVNVITTGVAWARANSGGAQASVSLLQVTDDKAQALFDNCFKVLDGPDAPDVTVQELNNEIILYLSNTVPTSNNFNENYVEFDPLIFLVDTGGNLVQVDTTFNFQGYKVFQIKNATVSAADLENADKARLIYQCDVKDGISRIINFEFDQSLGAGVPKEKVDGENIGVAHSLKVTQDAFATGSPNLINHKTYYFMAIAYGFNEYKKYQQDMPPGNNPLSPAYDGQKKPYKQGRKNIKVYSAIPHNTTMYSQGTEIHGDYGNGPSITRIEGNGNGGMTLDLTAATVINILNSPTHRVERPSYAAGKGPINVKVVDPLNVPDGHNFQLQFDTTGEGTNVANSNWVITNLTTGAIISSDKTIKAVNEQLLMQWGLSIAIEQPADPGSLTSPNGFIEATMSFSDPSKKWLSALADLDGPYYSNWIRSGTIASDPFQSDYAGTPNPDIDQVYETVLAGTWAPYRLTACTDALMASGYDATKYYAGPGFKTNFMNQPQLKDLASVDVVLTSDKSKWTRSVVIEMCEDTNYSVTTSAENKKARKLDFRRAPSVDKNGVANYPSADNNDYPSGMGWFPGYAINLETGERLNIAFGENSALSTGVFNHNGGDMLWNPTSKSTDSIPWATGKTGPVYGGQHYIYVFGHNKDNSPNLVTPVDTINVPRYDMGKRMRDILAFDNNQPTDVKKRELYRDAMWVNIPLLASGQSLLSSDVTVRLRVAKTYKPGFSSAYFLNGTQTLYTDTAATAFGLNKNLPMYTFSTDEIATHTADSELPEPALDEIRVVPNPYYAFSAYESSNLDNRVKITNLPEKCTVSIYNLSGALIRKYTKGQAYSSHAAFSSAVTTTSNSSTVISWDGTLDWDLKNTAGIPISSGVYVIHIEVPDVGEKVIKWFGIMRPIDLDSF